MNCWQKFSQDWSNKRILIMGLGLHGGGVKVAKIFFSLGCSITITDLRNRQTLKPSIKKLAKIKARYVLGGHQEKDFRDQDLIIRNPGVPQQSKFLQIARRHQIPIKMETALFASYTPATLIGITGTRGKSTTAHLVYRIVKQAGKQVFLAGNLPGKISLSLLKKTKKNNLVVLELSSWQLQGMDEEKVSPHLAVVTNIYPDHLNRYQNINEYIADKKIITKYQTNRDYLLLNKANHRLRDFAASTRANIIWFDQDDLPSRVKLKIPGDHNRENAAAALAVAKVLNIKYPLAIAAIKKFPGIPYRLETITFIKGVRLVNDTTSTTPIATIKALQTISQPIILILGGETKNLPVGKLAQTINNRAKKVVLLKGSGTDQIKTKLRPQLISQEFSNQDKAVRFALSLATSGDTVLFSPGFTSFGMYNNEFERGQAFNRTIKSIKAKL